MIQGKRFGLSAAQKRDVWRLWKAGDSLHKIGHAFGKEHSSIVVWCRVTVGLFRRSGGARSSRSRCVSARRSLEGSLAVRRFDEIAKRLDRVASTVSREVARHGGRPESRANEADCQAWESALRPKR